MRSESLYQFATPAIIGTKAIVLIVYEFAGLFGINSHPSFTAVHCNGKFLGDPVGGSLTISKKTII